MKLLKIKSKSNSTWHGVGTFIISTILKDKDRIKEAVKAPTRVIAIIIRQQKALFMQWKNYR